MLIGESDEIEIGQTASPHQFSADYGPVQDPWVNGYIVELGQRITAVCHRKQMPYTFRCVNASYVNAYAFPSGDIAFTRGILLMMENEAELASVLAHEIAHVNARHTASQISKQYAIMGTVMGLSILASETDHKEWEPFVMGLGAIGGGMLLARYSRDDERQADEVGQQYMVQAGFNPMGMVGVMDKLNKLEGSDAFWLTQLFATHPMSADRFADAMDRAKTKYAEACSRSDDRDRYMDSVASVRASQGVIEALQKGDDALYSEKMDQAVGFYQQALRLAPDDYEALLKMANARLLQQKPRAALDYCEQAKRVYPGEPQAWHLGGMMHIRLGQYDDALDDFERYAEALPGNPTTTFYRGRALDGQGQSSRAAELYEEFLKQVQDGVEADHARMRLEEWGIPVPQAYVPGQPMTLRTALLGNRKATCS